MESIPMLLEEVHEICPVQKGNWFVFGKLTTVPPVMTGRDKNSLDCTFGNHCSVEIAHCRNRDDHVVSFRLNHEFPPSDRIRIEGNGIDSSISACLGDSDLSFRFCEFLFE